MMQSKILWLYGGQLIRQMITMSYGGAHSVDRLPAQLWYRHILRGILAREKKKKKIGIGSRSDISERCDVNGSY